MNTLRESITINEAIKPTDYLSAFRRRLEHNHNNLLTLGEQLKNLGYVVKVWKSKPMLSAITVYTKDQAKGVRVQFNEVPYRFSFEYDIKPSIENGSGRTGKEFFVGSYSLPFSIDDVIKAVSPMYIDARFEHFKDSL
jgi:hypothetical protein